MTDIDQIALEAAREIEYFRWYESETQRVAATQSQIAKAIYAYAIACPSAALLHEGRDQ